MREEAERPCSTCGAPHPISHYARKYKGSEQRDWRCKACQRARTIARKAKDPERFQARHRETMRRRYHANPAIREAQRDYRLRTTFGISNERYEALLQEQGGRCAICRCDRGTKSGRKFAIDHCHITGRVRGLLCSNCNVGIGNLRDNPEILRRAIKYLKRRLDACASDDAAQLTLMEM